MSLIRQLWLAVIISAVLGFCGSLLLSIWSAQSYLSEQLGRKNNDTASYLALTMNHQEKDPVLIELSIAALFDTGFYQKISMTDPHGDIIVQREQTTDHSTVPDWFVHLFPLQSVPGRAQVSDGWQQYGTIEVISHTSFAYEALWHQATRLLLWFFIGGGVVGLAGMFWLRTISRSIKQVVHQADSIGNRRFITIEEPATPELKSLAKAMNGMVIRVQQMIEEAAGRLEELRYAVNYDALTGLAKRDYFMAGFKELLQGDSAVSTGALAVIRLTSLDRLNQTLGRRETDQLLQKLGTVLQTFCDDQEGRQAGRVKAAEFAIVLAGEQDPDHAADDIATCLQQYFLDEHDEVMQDIYHLGVISFEHGALFGETLAKVDHALAQAQIQGRNASYAIIDSKPVNAIPGEKWRELLTEAVREGRTRLEYYPVIKQDGPLIHHEGMVRIQPLANKPQITAGDFMPVAAHLNLTSLIDFEVLRMAVAQLKSSDTPVAVNLSAKTIENWTFRDKLETLLQQNQEVCSNLWVEVAEYGAFKYFDAFKDLTERLNNLGCHIGIEQFGQKLSESKRLAELGLDYIKLHPSLIHKIDKDTDNQQFIRRFCEICHAMGIWIIAVGVRNEREIDMLRSLGVDGITGPVVNDPADT